MPNKPGPQSRKEAAIDRRGFLKTATSGGHGGYRTGVASGQAAPEAAAAPAHRADGLP